MGFRGFMRNRRNQCAIGRAMRSLPLLTANVSIHSRAGSSLFQGQTHTYAINIPLNRPAKLPAFGMISIIHSDAIFHIPKNCVAPAGPTLRGSLHSPI